MQQNENSGSAAAPVTIITGAGRGIGRAVALELRELGHRLVLAARNLNQLNDTIRLACGSCPHDDALAVLTDVTIPAQVEALVQSAVQRFGRIDAIVNNAGLAPARPLVETSVDEWRAVLDTNLSSAFYLSKFTWPVFERQQSGVIVNISSAAARDPVPGFAAYASAKAGVNLLGLCAAREGERIGVRVHTIAPAAVETGMFRQLLTPDQYPTEDALQPQEVARVVADCITGRLAYTSGEVVYIHKRM